jgi:hypothetical protein
MRIISMHSSQKHRIRTVTSYSFASMNSSCSLRLLCTLTVPWYLEKEDQERERVPPRQLTLAGGLANHHERMDRHGTPYRHTDTVRGVEPG